MCAFYLNHKQHVRQNSPECVNVGAVIPFIKTVFIMNNKNVKTIIASFRLATSQMETIN